MICPRTPEKTSDRRSCHGIRKENIMKAPYRLLYNNDTTNTAGIVSPWHEEGEPFREDHLVASIAEVAKMGVDAYMLSPGMGWVPWWQSNVDPDFYAWWKNRTGLEVGSNSCIGLAVESAGYDRYVYEGGDMVKVLVATCRKHGMAPFVSLRLNDVHLQENYARKNQASLVSCRLYAEHPEWHVDPDHPNKEGYYPLRGMNWAIPEVREYKLALLRELAEKYDLAGLELDFLRDDHLFRQGEVADADRINIITDFVAQVRQALDARPGTRRHICVRIPLQLSAHPCIGLNVARLRDVGVDMFNLSGWYHTTQRTDVAAARKLLPDAAIYLELTHSTAWYPYFLKSGNYGTNGDPRPSDHQFYTTARLALERGADGISLFNFVYYRHGHNFDIPVMEPPFYVLPKLTDRAFLARQSQYYMLAGTCYYNQLPRKLSLGTAETFQMDLAPRHNHNNRPIRLRVHTKRPLTTEDRLAASINGTPLEQTEDTSRFFGNPFDGMISPVNHRCAWIVPGGILVNGLNDLVLQLSSGEAIDIIYIDLAIP